jgi:rhamnosyltransferase
MIGKGLLSDRTVCGVVITYLPSDGIADRLTAIINQVDMLVVVDNSASVAINVSIEHLAGELGAHFISNAQNLGIATALNQGAAFAAARGANWVVFFDQDSKPVEDFRQEIENVLTNYRGAQPLGIVGCNYIIKGNETSRFPTNSAYPEDYFLTDSVITSGSAYEMAMMSKLGPFKDAFFIDGVDIEYCWRALTNGYRVCRTKKPLLEHALGASNYHNFLGRRLGTSNHRAFRRYFMTRNAILIFREYFFRLPRLSLHLLGVQMKWAVLLLVFETDRRKKLGLALRGLWHGLIKRMDPEPWRMIK